MKDEIEKAVEKRFLKIRGWESWEQYDKIQESSELDKNIRFELIAITKQETLKNIHDTDCGLEITHNWNCPMKKRIKELK